MKAALALATLLAIGRIGCAGDGFGSRPDLTLENKSGAPVLRVDFRYGDQVARFEDIPDAGKHELPYDGISADTAFDLRWRDSSGKARHAKFLSYFLGDPLRHLRFQFLPGGGLRMLNGREFVVESHLTLTEEP